MWLAGGLLAGIVLLYGIVCVVTGEASVPNLRLRGLSAFGQGLFVTVRGTPALCIGCAAVCAAAFAHFQWFWGNHRRLVPYHAIGKCLALLGLAGAAAAYVFLIVVRG